MIYSLGSQDTFNKLIELAGISKNMTKSGKLKKTSGCNKSEINIIPIRTNYVIDQSH